MNQIANGAAPDLNVANVRPWGRSPVDIAIADGRIIAITPHGEQRQRRIAAGTGAEKYLDGQGMLALPGFVNSHAHVDKSWWGKPWVSYGGEPTTQGRISHERTHRGDLGIPSVESTLAVLREFLQHGTTVIRTHVDVDMGIGLSAIAIVREALEELAVMGAQIVAFPQDGVLRRPGVLELLDQAAGVGADFIGGLDPASIDRDPVGQLDGVFAIAERRGVGVDVHLHDGGELGAFQIELMIERTLRAGLQGKVNVAHGFAVGQVSTQRQLDLASAMGEAGISMTSVAPIRTAPLPIAALREHGVKVGLGTDGIRDLWGPYGTGDMLAIATRWAQLSGFRHDEELELAVRMASSDAASFVGREVHDIAVGAVADIVLVNAENVPDALVRAPVREHVIANGVLMFA